MTNINPVNFVTVGLMSLIFTFLWRMVAARLSETRVGQAMAAVL